MSDRTVCSSSWEGWIGDVDEPKSEFQDQGHNVEPKALKPQQAVGSVC